MCIIIHVPQGAVHPNRDKVEYAWESNPHFGGIMYVDENNEIQIVKKKSKDKLIDEFYRILVKYGNTTPVTLHFRFATHGAVSLNNTHPFKINNNVAMMHNGTIYKCTPNEKQKKKNWSDTRVFVETLLKKLPAGWEQNGVIYDLIENYVGQSRLCFLTKNRDWVILNAQKGEWIDGCWFSNDYYKNRRHRWVKGDKEEMVAGKWVPVPSKRFHYYSETYRTYTKKHNKAQVVVFKPKEDDRIMVCDGCCKNIKKVGLLNTWFVDDTLDETTGQPIMRKAKLCYDCRLVLFNWLRGPLLFNDKEYSLKLWTPKVCNICENKYQSGYTLNWVFDFSSFKEVPDVYSMCNDCMFKTLKGGYKFLFEKIPHWFVNGEFRYNGEKNVYAMQSM